MSRKSTFNPIHESPGGLTSEYLAIDGDFKRISSDMQRLSLQKESFDCQPNIYSNEKLTDMLMARPMSHANKSSIPNQGRQLKRFKSVNRAGASYHGTMFKHM